MDSISPYDTYGVWHSVVTFPPTGSQAVVLSTCPQAGAHQTIPESNQGLKRIRSGCRLSRRKLGIQNATRRDFDQLWGFLGKFNVSLLTYNGFRLLLEVNTCSDSCEPVVVTLTGSSVAILAGVEHAHEHMFTLSTNFN